MSNGVSTTYAAGSDVRGVWQHAATVELVRVERSPLSTIAFPVATAIADADGAFSIVIPDDSPPTVTGQVCGLTWALRIYLLDGSIESQPFVVVE